MRNEIVERADRIILDLYSGELGRLTPLFPLNPKHVFLILLPHECRLISYQTLAKTQGTSVEKIAKAFGSEDGCTHYDMENNRYLVAYNANRYGPRIRWTLAHELGHILCGHLTEIAYSGRREIPEEDWQNMEEEADYFAASLLAPIPAIRKAKVQSADGIRRRFGLSSTAAGYRWSEFRRSSVHTELDECFDGIWLSFQPNR